MSAAPSPRLPRDAREAAVAALADFDRDPEGRVGELLQLNRLEARDQALAREITLGVVRRQRLIDHLLGMWAERGLPRSYRGRAALRSGAYQLLFLDRIPDHAAVDCAVRFTPVRFRGLTNALLRRLAGARRDGAVDDPRRQLPLGEGRHLELPGELPADPVLRAALIGGLPDFLVQRWAENYGADRAAEIALASCETPGVHLRAVGCDREALAQELVEAGVEVEAVEHPRLLRWVGGRTPFAAPAFREGRFAVQDPTALRAAEAVAASPGDSVLDLCAAPGTKAAVIAEAVGEGGRVYAYDKDAERLERVWENVERLHMPWIRPCKNPEALAPFDRVLVDVPCSNSGVLSRRVEVRHRLDPELFADLPHLQRRILDRALSLVKPGGRVVYSTCSIEPEENEAVVDGALAELGRGERVESKLSLPESPLQDGGYYAVLQL